MKKMVELEERKKVKKEKKNRDEEVVRRDTKGSVRRRIK